MSFLESLFSLKGKRAVVTGAARGLGLAMTEGLLRADAHVAMVGSNEERLKEQAAIFESKGLPATPMTCDLGAPEQLAALIDNILAGGPVHVLVNNAGVTHTLSWPSIRTRHGAARLTSTSARRFNWPAWSSRLLSVGTPCQ